MALIAMTCSICGHDVTQIVGCGRDDCHFKDAPKPHSHCDHESEHGLCTSVGCMKVVGPPRVVNPPLDGSTPDRGLALDVLNQVRDESRTVSRIEFQSAFGLMADDERSFVLNPGDTLKIRLGDHEFSARIDRQLENGTWVAAVDTPIQEVTGEPD